MDDCGWQRVGKSVGGKDGEKGKGQKIKRTKGNGKREMSGESLKNHKKLFNLQDLDRERVRLSKQ